MTLHLTEPRSDALGAEVALSVRADLQPPLTLRYALEVIEANQEVPVWVFESGNLEISDRPRGGTHRLPETITLPPLDEGYYFLRATLVATDRKQDAADRAELHVVVEGRSLWAIDPIEWFDRSGEMKAKPFLNEATEGAP